MTIEGKISIGEYKKEIDIPRGGSHSGHLGGTDDGIGFLIQDFGNDQPDTPNGGSVQVSGRLAKNLDSQFLVREPIARDDAFEYEIKLNGEQVIQVVLNHHT